VNQALGSKTPDERLFELNADEVRRRAEYCAVRKKSQDDARSHKVRVTNDA
jgi:hypothetical protein